MRDKKQNLVTWLIIIQLLFVCDALSIFLLPYRLIYFARIGYCVALVRARSLLVILFALWQIIAVAFLAYAGGQYELVMAAVIGTYSQLIIPKLLSNFQVQYFVAVLLLACMVVSGVVLSGAIPDITCVQAILQIIANMIILYGVMYFMS